MKIILSRKGFDSEYGKQPSPILPDGKLISFPIPSKDDIIKFIDLNYQDKNYFQIIHELNPRSKIKENFTCHLDPDLVENVKARSGKWVPAFGQGNASNTHLRNQNVTKDDVFLFFGLFRKTEYKSGKLKYRKDSPPIHLIFGYLQIGKIYSKFSEIPDYLSNHPHTLKSLSNNPNNSIYESKKKLSFLDSISGAGIFNFDESLILTKSGFSISKWNLPVELKDVKISYHSKNSFHDNYFQSVGKGQEFVIEENEFAINWMKNIIKSGLNL